MDIGNNHRTPVTTAGSLMEKLNLRVKPLLPLGPSISISGDLHPLFNEYFPITAENTHFARVLVSHPYNYDEVEYNNRTLMCEEFPYRSKITPKLIKCKRFPRVSC